MGKHIFQRMKADRFLILSYYPERIQSAFVQSATNLSQDMTDWKREKLNLFL